MNLIGKITKYDLSKGEVLLQLSFLDEEIIKKLEEIFQDDKFTKVQIKNIRLPKSLESDKLRKKWFSILTSILEWQDIHVTSTILDAFHKEMKESMFEVTRYIVDGKIIPIVPSINSLSDEELYNACELLINRYSSLGCIFKI